MPQIIKDAEQLRRVINGRSVALTPTMGALHEGHLSLARCGRERAQVNAVSVYVNPAQFGAGEDFDAYPRDLAADCEKLKGVADIVFAPDNLYPQDQTVGISLPPVAGELCGKFRPGFFEGVALAVCKLLNCVCPQVAMFGKKDFQQLHIVRLLAAQMNYPVQIVAGETVREPDGLAMSSRNTYLSSAGRKQAALLPESLRAAADQIAKGENPAAAAAQVADCLHRGGFAVDYAEARDARTLGAPDNEQIVVLAAATLERARLIDNIECRAPRRQMSAATGGDS